MKLSTLEYYIVEVLRSLRRNNWMSVASVATVAVSLFILGTFSLVIMNINRMVTAVESQVEISVYLYDNVTKEQQRDIFDGIKQLQGVDTVQFVDKTVAFERMQDRLGDQRYLLDALDGENPLPNGIEVTVKEASLVKPTAESITKIEGVESAKYGQDVVEHLFDITRLLRIMGVLLMALLFFSTLFIISNTIRLTIFARRKEIAIMKYVGATDWFIRWPFYMEGMVLGFVGGTISALSLRLLYSAIVAKAYSTVAFLPLLPMYPFMNHVTLGIIVSGVLIGLVGSVISLRKFLKV